MHFFSCSTPGTGLYSSRRQLKPIFLAKDLHQMLKPKNIGIWDATNIAKRCVKQHSFRHCLTRFFTSDGDLQCALYSTLCTGRFQRKFCKSRRKVSTIPYRPACMISRVGAQRPGSWNCGQGWTAVHYKVVNLMNCDYRKKLEKTNGIAQNELTLAYTIDAFGLNAGRIFNTIQSSF